jgi:hypothetical protein
MVLASRRPPRAFRDTSLLQGTTLGVSEIVLEIVMRGRCAHETPDVESLTTPLLNLEVAAIVLSDE